MSWLSRFKKEPDSTSHMANVTPINRIPRKERMAAIYNILRWEDPKTPGVYYFKEFENEIRNDPRIREKEGNLSIEACHTLMNATVDRFVKSLSEDSWDQRIPFSSSGEIFAEITAPEGALHQAIEEYVSGKNRGNDPRSR